MENVYWMHLCSDGGKAKPVGHKGQKPSTRSFPKPGYVEGFKANLELRISVHDFNSLCFKTPEESREFWEIVKRRISLNPQPVVDTESEEMAENNDRPKQTLGTSLHKTLCAADGSDDALRDHDDDDELLGGPSNKSSKAKSTAKKWIILVNDSTTGNLKAIRCSNLNVGFEEVNTSHFDLAKKGQIRREKLLTLAFSSASQFKKFKLALASGKISREKKA